MGWEALDWGFFAQAVAMVCIVGVYFSTDLLLRAFRKSAYTRGIELDRNGKDSVEPGERKWGTHGVSPAACRNHFLAMGRSDSGKSLMLQRLMSDVVMSITPGSDRRVFMYDAKNELVPYLMKLGVDCPVLSVNPLESRTKMPRSVYWDIKRDVNCVASAENFGHKMIPESDEGANRFFSDAARILITSMCESFARHSPNSWTFSDLVYAALSPERLVSVLERDEDGMDVLENIMREGRTAYQVFTTLQTRIRRFRPAAGLYQRSTDGVSLKEWVQAESIILFGANARIKEAVDPLYEMMFATLVEEMDELPDSKTRETFCVLDEVRLCKPVIRSGMLNYFATKARSKGGVLVLGFQDFHGLVNEIGEDLAKELCGQCQNQAYLWFSSMDSAKWAADQVGEIETLESFVSQSGDVTSKSRTVSEQRVTKHAILPSEFVAFEKPTPQKGIKGVFIKAGESPKLRVVPGSEFPFACSDQEKLEHGIHRRPPSDQTLIPWSIERQQELGMIIEKDRLTLNDRQLRYRKETMKQQERAQELERDQHRQEIYERVRRAAECYDQTLSVKF